MGMVLRLIRRVLWGVILLAVLLSTFGYAVYAANGILDEVEQRNRRGEHDRMMPGTATAIAERLTESAATATFTPSTTPTATATETATATATLTPSPTRTPTDTSAPTRTPPPTGTARPTRQPATATPQGVALAQAAAAAESPTAIPTNTPRATVIPTNTPRPSLTPLPSATETPSLTFTPSLTPTASPTLTPSIAPTATYVIEGTYSAPYLTPVVEIPPRVPLMEDDPEIVNIALLGSDTIQGAGIGRTDVIILVSVNKRANTAAMWHLPRDLFVYIPNHTMDRINLAFAYGARSDFPGGAFGLFKETVLYNFGIELDYYARVDFDDFQLIVKELGGVEVSVDCAITDWRLIDPELDPTLEESWEQYTLPIGRQKLEPYMALWYARSRVTTSDFDRGRRQMDLLRAMWYQAREQGLFEQVTELWPEASAIIDTNMTLTDVLGFVPLAASLDMSAIARYGGTAGVHYEAFKTPDDGRSVFLPKREALIPLIHDFLTPPTSNRLSRQATSIEVIDASNWNIGFDAVASDRLAWEGFATIRGGSGGGAGRDLTVLYDYTGQAKGSVLQDLMRVLRVSEAQVVVEPDPNRAVDFRVEIGRGYNSCVQGNAEDELQQGPPIAEAAPDGP